MLERNSVRGVNTKGTVIMDDGTNEAKIPGFPYIFVAKGDKILLAVDIFKSGYECRTCEGKTTIDKKCKCENPEFDRPGFKYSSNQISDFMTDMGRDIAAARTDIKCPECLGDYISRRTTEVCPECKGKGALLHLADESKTLPTTGVIVSMGELVNPKLGYKCGQRVLFGAYVGVMIPTRAPGVVFKVMRDIEILCEIKGGEDLANFDFVTIDKEM